MVNDRGMGNVGCENNEWENSCQGNLSASERKWDEPRVCEDATRKSFDSDSDANDDKERERLKIKLIQIDNVRVMIGVRKTDQMRNERLREFVGVHKGVDEICNERKTRWYGNKKIMNKNKIVKIGF